MVTRNNPKSPIAEFSATDFSSEAEAFFGLIDDQLSFIKEIHNQVEQEIPENSEKRKTILTILTLSFRSLLSVVILCRHGLDDEGRTHGRKLFELFVTIAYIATKPEQLPQLYNRNEVISLMITFHRYTSLESTMYNPNFPSFDIRKEWLQQAHTDFKEFFADLDLPFPDTVDKMPKTFTRSWSGKSVNEMLQEVIAENQDNPELVKAFNSLYDMVYRTESQFKHLSGIGRRSAYSVTNSAFDYNYHPSKKRIDDALHVATANCLRVLTEIVEFADCTNQSGQFGRLEALNTEFQKIPN